MQRRGFVRSTMTTAMTTALPRESLARWYRLAGQDPGDVVAVRGDGGKVTLKGSSIAELRAALRGKVLLPKDAGYDEARQVVNPSIDKRPALIVQTAGAADVRTAVAFAQS